MNYLRITLRVILSIIAFLYVITILSDLFKSNITDLVSHISGFVSLFIQIPLTLVMLFISAYNYFTKKSFWSILKIEYYFLLASLFPFIIGFIVALIWILLAHFN